MTTPALVKQSDLKRMAAIAKREGVTVWIEIDGKKVGVSPNIPTNHSPTPVDADISFGGNSLSAWRARHEGKSGGNPSRQQKAR